MSDGDEIRLHHVPAATIAFGEKRIAGFVRIVDTEITNEALVIVALDVLQRGFRNHVAVSVLFFGITEQSERKSQIGEPPAIAARFRLAASKVRFCHVLLE